MLEARSVRQPHPDEQSDRFASVSPPLPCGGTPFGEELAVAAGWPILALSNINEPSEVKVVTRFP